MATRTITLTGRRPVVIDEADWPRIASASHRDWSGQYDFQAYDLLRQWIAVRQHADGRTIVYGGSEQDGRMGDGHDVRGGYVLSAGEDVPAAIEKLAQDLADAGAHAPIHVVARDCIADLPAERI